MIDIPSGNPALLFALRIAVCFVLVVLPTLAEAEQDAWPMAVSHQVLNTSGQPVGIELAIVVFDDGLDAFDERDARHKLRRVEARIATVLLRDVITEGQRFGPVRVLPADTAFAALTITGSVVHSDGRDMLLRIRAVDVSGELWFEQVFRWTASAQDYLRPSDEPFRPLFVAIANALWTRAQTLSPASIAQLEALAKMRYAAELAPQIFNDYVQQVEGLIRLTRLPAANDPMLARIDRIRRQEALFIDTIDQQYRDLQDALGPVYTLWRRSSLEQGTYLASYLSRANQRSDDGDSGSFARMQQAYSTYRSVKMQEQDLFEIATGFDNETAPTVLDSGERVVRLEGTLEQQYVQWRDILRRLITLERGSLE